MKRRPKEYEGDGIVVQFDAHRCIHAAECVRGLPSVFDANARPWITPQRASAAKVEEVVRRCPSGALQYRRTDGSGDEIAPKANTARIVPDGPLHVSGRLLLQGPDGETVEETRLALCRCGNSQNKPYCDNTHVKSSFSDPGSIAQLRGAGADHTVGPLTIQLAPNGPILTGGPLQVIADSGEMDRTDKCALCRCGASQTKPYCDGSHVKTGFSAE